MLEQIDGAIESGEHKIDLGRVYEPENEKVRIQWIKAFGYLLRTKPKILDDRDRAEMVAEIRELRERREREPFR